MSDIYDNALKELPPFIPIGRIAAVSWNTNEKEYEEKVWKMFYPTGIVLPLIWNPRLNPKCPVSKGFSAREPFEILQEYLYLYREIVLVLLPNGQYQPYLNFILNPSVGGKIPFKLFLVLNCARLIQANNGWVAHDGFMIWTEGVRNNQVHPDLLVLPTQADPPGYVHPVKQDAVMYRGPVQNGSSVQKLLPPPNFPAPPVPIKKEKITLKDCARMYAPCANP